MKEFFKNITAKKWRNIGIGVLIISLVLFIYFFGKNEGEEDEQKKVLEQKANSTAVVKLPNNGSGIPTGWSATPSATKIYVAMKGWGTDENAFFTTLDTLTDDQIAAVYNKFNELYETSSGYNLIEWIQADFSGGELSRALAYFDGLY